MVAADNNEGSQLNLNPFIDDYQTKKSTDHRGSTWQRNKHKLYLFQIYLIALTDTFSQGGMHFWSPSSLGDGIVPILRGKYRKIEKHPF